MGKGLDLKHLVRHPSLKIALALALTLASAGAAALGLGQIEVKSRIGQPLLAEIPIISRDPAELEELRAGLASPETFARIGLQPPRGLVADLQFAPALDAAGRPIIRVTSAQPVREPLLTFLVQVDWGQGRLVREYSALVDTPRTVSAPVQPPIDAPVVSQPDLIERPAPSAIVATPPPTPAPAAAPLPAPEATRAAEPAPRDKAIVTAVPVPKPVPVPVAPAPYVAQSTAGASEYGPVKAGESLSQIARRLEIPGGTSIEHSMIALLRANPGAFIGGNINQLKRGAVLRVPASSETADIDARQAMALVQAQARQWRQARRAVPPPVADPSRATPTGRTATKPAPVATRASGARLEIVPPGANRATRAGTQSGINAGGEGQMLRQELQQTKESLAARDAELRELKGRVADLEKLQADQQQLLTLKDSELAAAQQRLAASNNAVAAPVVAAPTGTTATAETAAPAETQASILPWVLGGFGVLVLALLAGWWLRRRPASTPKFVAPAPMSAASLADAFAPFPPKTPEQAAGTAAPAPAPFVAMPAADAGPAPGLSAAPVDTAAAPLVSTPAAPIEQSPAAIKDSSALWDRRDRQKLPTGRAELPAAPAWHAGAVKSQLVEAPVAVAADASVGERLELAQAYLDLGDLDSARQLLGEVAGSGDQASRQQASRMLREMD